VRIFYQEGLGTGRAWFAGRIDPMIQRHVTILSKAFLFTSLAAFALPALAAENATFDRTFTVTAPVRIELSNGSGSVEIKGSSDGRVHIHGKVTPGGWSIFRGSGKNIEEVAANPPLEQSGSTIRIGKNSSWLKNVTIDYQMEVPHDTEIDAGVASGGITIDNVKGPVKASSASGYVHVYRVERDTQVNAASGSIDVSAIGGCLRVSSASGDTRVVDVKGELKITAASGSIRIEHASDRVDASTASGSIDVVGANNDVKVHAISGSIQVSGNPGASRLWELKTISGSVQLRVPSNASFLLSAESTSGDIRTSIPVILEEQNKHSLRAHIGNSAGRVEVHTVSGSVNVSSGS
jgi:putative adhesin